MTEGSKSHFNNFIRGKDIFAPRIFLSFNGEKSYKTPYGGILSMSSALIVMVWIIV